MCLLLEPQPRFEIFPFMSLHSLASGLVEKQKPSGIGEFEIEYFKLLVSFHKKMRLLTHNMLTSHVKGVKNGYPLGIEVTPLCIFFTWFF